MRSAGAAAEVTVLADLLNGGDFDNINTSSRPLAATFDARAALAMETGTFARCGRPALPR
jgi:hypothetical protein